VPARTIQEERDSLGNRFFNHRGPGAAFDRNQDRAPTDLVSVVSVILHYEAAHETVAAPTELVSVERMILHFGKRIVANHASTESSSAGGDKSFAPRELAEFV
jgi:hypothetical protein